MNIFSKLFGSKTIEDQKEVEEVISPTEETSIKEESLPDPQNLPEAMRYVVQKWGITYLQNRSLLNILNDFQLLKDIPAAKHILKNMQANGYIEKVSKSSNWTLDSKSIAAKYSTEFGAKEDIVIYLVQCIGYGLGKNAEAPQFIEKEEVSQPQYIDPASQTINFPPQKNNQPIVNNIPLQPTPQPVPAGPYNPKDDLPGYNYPSLDLLEDSCPDDESITLKSILGSQEYQKTLAELPCAIGKKGNGEILMFDLAEAPHLMVSGSSGMGVSIFFNCLITSLLYKKHPAEVKFVMVDPKKIEFSLYRPLEKHFLASAPENEPVVTDLSKSFFVFSSLCKEIDIRLKLMGKASVRNIKDYNRLFCDRKLNPSEGHRFMPYIILLIDEYDDLTRMWGKETDRFLEKITKMGRATGIHLIVSVLRPVGTVISSSIKTNIFGRIAFRVTSANDSRNILGQSGAEKLQRPGDMIYTNGVNIVKGRCAYMDILEVKRINDFIKNQTGYREAFELPDPNEEENTSTNDVDMQHLDPMFEDAARLIVREQCGSTSLIQRKFVIGYNRAGRLMDQLEKAGIVGQAYGSKPREVLVKDMQSLERILKAWR